MRLTALTSRVRDGPFTSVYQGDGHSPDVGPSVAAACQALTPASLGSTDKSMCWKEAKGSGPGQAGYKEEDRCQAQRMPLTTQSGPLQGEIQDVCANSKPPWVAMGSRQVVSHLCSHGNPRVGAGPLLSKKGKGQVGLSTVHQGKDKGRLFELKDWGLELRSGSNFKIEGIVKRGGEGVIKGIWEISLGVGLLKEV